MNKKQLAEAIREEKRLKVCRKHPRPVHHQEKICPVCRIEKEWLVLTNDMK